jgi:hypothetical protein
MEEQPPSGGASSGGVCTFSSGASASSNGAGDGGCLLYGYWSGGCSYSCRCPEGTCQCSNMSGTAYSVPFTGCPACPADGWAACGLR